jgi:hypothetical protein
VTASLPVASGLEHNPKGINPNLVRTKKIADPTADAAIRNILTQMREADFAVVDNHGEVIFRIRPDVLREVLPLLTFTKTRRGRDTIRAHKKKAATDSYIRNGSMFKDQSH